MSHAFDCHTFWAHYNDDFSGPVQFVHKKSGQQFYVPGRAILDLVAEFIRREQIAEQTIVLENASTSEILFPGQTKVLPVLSRMPLTFTGIGTPPNQCDLCPHLVTDHGPGGCSHCECKSEIDV